MRNLGAPMAQRVELQSARPISELRCPPATELMWQPPPKDRHPVAPALKGRSAALQYCLHRSAPRESCQTRNLGKTPKPERFISVAECCCRYRTRRTDHVAWGTGPAGRPHRPTQAGLCDARSLSKGCLLSPDTGVDSPQAGVQENRCNARRYLTSPVPLWPLAVASTPYVRREGNSYPARNVDNEKDEQKGSKNAATNIHLLPH